MTVTIRPAEPADCEALREIERLAGERFREVGLDSIADDEPPPSATLIAYARAGRAWVACDGSGAPVGYVLVDVVDGCAHVEQVSVHPERQGAGVGGALLDRVEAWATSTDRRVKAITLTTFTDVAWNRPLFEHLGFRVVTAGEIGPELRARCDAEAARGLDPARRVCMRRPVVALIPVRFPTSPSG